MSMTAIHQCTFPCTANAGYTAAMNLIRLGVSVMQIFRGLVIADAARIGGAA